MIFAIRHNDLPPLCVPGSVTKQPQVVIMQPAPLDDPPSDGLFFAVFVTACCCLPIGIFAIIRSVQCRSAIEASHANDGYIDHMDSSSSSLLSTTTAAVPATNFASS